MVGEGIERVGMVEVKVEFERRMRGGEEWVVGEEVGVGALEGGGEGGKGVVVGGCFDLRVVGVGVGGILFGIFMEKEWGGGGE